VQARQGVDEFLVPSFAFVAGRFDALEHLPDRVDHVQQRGGDLRVENHFAVAQAAQQIFTRVGDRFELGEPQKTAGALDGVDGAENTGQSFAVAGIPLQLHEFAVQRIQVLVALDQKFADDVFAHRTRATLSLCFRPACMLGPHRPEQVIAPGWDIGDFMSGLSGSVP
jgi:hypothetical protein